MSKKCVEKHKRQYISVTNHQIEPNSVPKFTEQLGQMWLREKKLNLHSLVKLHFIAMAIRTSKVIIEKSRGGRFLWNRN